ncbi:hypothetical protein F5Y14DRAFT_290288 [Nemania sp. NC0429]|nr:hypothetical protein F5Y14DRAFT_290288 [Nemania sp. NC0429]
MSLGKWKLSRRRPSTESSGNSNISSSSSSSSSTFSSSLTTRASTPISQSSSSSNNKGNNKTSSSPSSSSFSWLRSSRRTSKRKSLIAPDDPVFARLNKPFTPENLEHQRIFSAFEWTFDDDDDDNSCRRRRMSLSLSPCTSRTATTVDDYADEEVDPHHIPPPTDVLSGCLARLSMREGPGRGVDGDNAA